MKNPRPYPSDRELRVPVVSIFIGVVVCFLLGAALGLLWVGTP